MLTAEAGIVRDGGACADLVVALGALSERQRASVVILHDGAGYPAREVAEDPGFDRGGRARPPDATAGAGSGALLEDDDDA